MLDLSHFLNKQYLMERQTRLQPSACDRRDLTCCTVHADDMMPNPIHLSPFLESFCLLGIHSGASAVGRTPASQRRMEGVQMIGMHVCGGYKLRGVGMLWRGSLIFGPFGTALMPLRPFILEPYFDACAQG